MGQRYKNYLTFYRSVVKCWQKQRKQGGGDTNSQTAGETARVGDRQIAINLMPIGDYGASLNSDANQSLW
jgi:hypothetical protein